MKSRFAMAGLLVLALAGPTPAATWLGIDTNWNNTANWSGGAVPGNGDAVVIPNLAIDPVMPAATYPAAGSFASFELQASASNTCLGDTGVVNEASGGTASSYHGTGVTIKVSGNATIDGRISATGRGFPGAKGPGYYANLYGGSYGGRSRCGASFSATNYVYGSVTNPTALGSGGGDGASGGAVSLSVGGTLTVNGEINANGVYGNVGGGSGGSINLTCATFAGTGLLSAQGGTGNSSYNRLGGGGRIAVVCNTKTFSGRIAVDGGQDTSTLAYAQPGTLWYPRMFEGSAGSAGSPANITITNGYQYYFSNSTPTYYWNLTVSNVWNEFHQGSLALASLTLTNRAILSFDQTPLGTRCGYDMNSLAITVGINVATNATLWLPAAGAYALGGDLNVDRGGILYCQGDTNAVNGGTVTVPYGTGVTIRVSGNATVAGTISAYGQGFSAASGPGFYATLYGGSYGGRGRVATTFVPVDRVYGSVTNPTALGSGGSEAGGGDVNLDVGGALTVSGEITANGVWGDSGGGSGGSISLTCDSFAGTGSVSAQGGGGNLTRNRCGGGGRIAIRCNSRTFSGMISAAGGQDTSTWAFAQSGTLYYPRMFDGLEGSAGSPANISITNGYQYYFTNTVPIYYWNLTLSNAWVQFHTGSLRVADLKLTNCAVLSFDENPMGTRSNYDMNSLAVTGGIYVATNATLWLPPEGSYTLNGNLNVDQGGTLYCQGDTNAVNGGTIADPRGTGVTLQVSGNATIDGTLSALGFLTGKGPGGSGGTLTIGGTHGGQGGDTIKGTYGQLTIPTALGSGGGESAGGGAVLLDVAGTLAVNGSLSAQGGNADYRAGSGGSVWLSCQALAGTGVISAAGGVVANPANSNARGGGGGRMALDYATFTFTGSLSVRSSAITAGTLGKTGTLFQCVSPYRRTFSGGYGGVALASVFSISSNNVKIARTVSRWGRGAACWTELSTDNGGVQLDNTATYSFSGLTPSDRYQIYDNEVLKSVLITDGSGGLSFAVTLTNGAHAIRVEGPAGTIVKFR